MASSQRKEWQKESNLMNIHITEDIHFQDDPHTVVPDADFSPLEMLYAGRSIYYGDFHCHSNSGGNSDGKTTPEEWLTAMKQLQIDFIGLMDHRQVRHMYLDSFDTEFFVCGSEPGGYWTKPELSFHYIMIVPEKEDLLHILEQFPDVFSFTGGSEGTFVYRKIEKSRFLQIIQATQDVGGVMVHAHPKQIMVSDDPMDYYFGDGTVLETIYVRGDADILNEDTVSNYKLWIDLLARGCKVFTTATNDCHGIPTNRALNAVYSDRKNGKAYTEYLRKGDLNAGFFGIKMSLEEHPSGSIVRYVPGSKLLVKIEDVHPAHFDPNDSYRLEILTDQGIAYTQQITLPFQTAIEVKERAFYRVVIIRESDNAPAAIGNPIWIEG